MSKISDLIFKNQNHYITSPFGKRSTIKTSAGTTSSYHNGTDYGTKNLKLPQYAIEDGYVFAAAKASDGAKYVWVIYPRIKKAFLHYHLDSISVKAGQAVKKGTELGKTGKTGKATGIHLHLGIRELSKLATAQIKNITWALLQSCSYIDPEKVSYTEPTVSTANEKIGGNDMTRGYFKKGDANEGVYIYKQMLMALKEAGVITQSVDDNNKFGDGTVTATKQVQKAAGLTQDGFAGPKTLRACYTLIAKKL